MHWLQLVCLPLVGQSRRTVTALYLESAKYSASATARNIILEVCGLSRFSSGWAHARREIWDRRTFYLNGVVLFPTLRVSQSGIAKAPTSASKV